MTDAEFLIAVSAYASVYAPVIKQFLVWFVVAGLFLGLILFTGLALQRGLSATM